MSSIGEMLAEARRQKGITIKDVEKSIKIRAKYVSALEENRFETIPGRAYVVGFIKTYANFLGLDSRDLIARYQGEQGFELSDKTAKPAQPQLPPRRTSIGWLRLLVVLALIILLLGAILVVINQRGSAAPLPRIRYSQRMRQVLPSLH